MDREQAIKIIKDCKEKSFKRTLYTLDEYYEAVDMAIQALEQQTCEDAISRQTVKELFQEAEMSGEYSFLGIDDLPPVTVQENKEDIHREREQAYMCGYEEAYKQGWHDAIEKALNEAYTIHHYGDIFRVVQEETLIGLGTAYEQVSTEKMGVNE